MPRPPGRCSSPATGSCRRSTSSRGRPSRHCSTGCKRLVQAVRRKRVFRPAAVGDRRGHRRAADLRAGPADVLAAHRLARRHHHRQHGAGDDPVSRRDTRRAATGLPNVDVLALLDRFRKRPALVDVDDRSWLRVGRAGERAGRAGVAGLHHRLLLRRPAAGSAIARQPVAARTFAHAGDCRPVVRPGGRRDAGSVSADVLEDGKRRPVPEIDGGSLRAIHLLSPGAD